jgi:hypothetical protein
MLSRWSQLHEVGSSHWPGSGFFLYSIPLLYLIGTFLAVCITEPIPKPDVLNPEDCGNMFFRNVGTLRDWTVSQPREPKSEKSVPWKLKKLSLCVCKIMWNYVISGDYTNKFSIVNTLHGRELCSTSRMSEKSFVCVVSKMWVLLIFRCGHVKCSVLYKGDCLRLIICACYLLEVTLNVGLDVLFDNM